MDVLLLCGYFEPQYQEEIAEKTKTWVENAANTFQQRLIRGLQAQDINLSIVSAPFIGAWPTAYREVFFRGFAGAETAEDSPVRYVAFNNIWGYRNLSRARAAKREVVAFLEKAGNGKKAIIVYAPHTPFLEAAVYAKRKDPAVHICLIVPDLPQFMNLSKKPHPVYDIFKKIDIKRFYQLNELVDSYMLLTEPMSEKLKVGKRPYIVVEGIADSVDTARPDKPRGKTVAYAGKLQESFGVKRLIEAFELIEDEEARLEICGGGELRAYVEEMCRKDARIIYHGVVSAEESRAILQRADVLVNPRQNDEEYTKYSFPSKNIEYLLTGNAVVAYMLDGMPECYRDFVLLPKDASSTALVDALQVAMTEPARTKVERVRAVLHYFVRTCTPEAVAEQVVRLLKRE